jgi:hypothetical protein
MASVLRLSPSSTERDILAQLRVARDAGHVVETSLPDFRYPIVNQEWGSKTVLEVVSIADCLQLIETSPVMNYHLVFSATPNQFLGALLATYPSQSGIWVTLEYGWLLTERTALLDHLGSQLGVYSFTT